MTESTRSTRVLLGVSGGIAACKAPHIVRRLRERGAEVRCAMTRSAEAFVTPLTLEVLSGHPVYREEYLEANGSGEELHIQAAEWADCLCVAPLTANTLARLALGLADDFLSTTVLAFNGPVVLAPAMHSVMWSKSTVQDHTALLLERGVRFVGPVLGSLASGDVGLGRMAEPGTIAAAALSAIGGVGSNQVASMAGCKVLVTAGPTREPLDPMRFLSNRSSGRMGFALAQAVKACGAETVLIAGPVSQPTPRGVERIDVVTAIEMNEQVRLLAPRMDVVVMAAAVSDFRPAVAVKHKIKKRDGFEAIQLARNPDILAGLRDIAPAAFLVGFAAETRNLEREARAKLESKRLDLVVGNDVSREDIGFESIDNEVKLFSRESEPILISRCSKEAVAERIVERICSELEVVDGRAQPAAG